MEQTKITESSILIAHIGDVHLRDTQYATSRRGIDFFSAFIRAIKAAAAAGADCLVCTGDNFDMSRPSAKVIGQLMQADATLRGLKLPMFTITGNHDYSNPSWLSTLFPGAYGEAACENNAVGICPLDGASVNFKGFVITGIPPYTSRVFEESKADTALRTEHSDVILYHGFVTGIVPAFTGDKHVLDVSDLPLSANNKAILLGDIHVQGFVDKPRPGGGTTLIGYPGSLEMCSRSESTSKSIPMIRLTKSSAVVEVTVPLVIRPYISRTVRTTEDLDNLVSEVSASKDSDPVVLVDFDRRLTETVTRIHAILDMQNSVVRCYPLPQERKDATIVEADSAKDVLGIEHFVSSRFADNAELGDVAKRLLNNVDDSANIISEFVQLSLDRMGEVACAY